MKSEPDHIHVLADHVALAYHEARNVRHLAKARLIDPAPWKYLISLPTNRTDAWRELQSLRHEARKSSSTKELLDLFNERFHVSLEELASMFANAAWLCSSYGGNAWHTVTLDLAELADAISSGHSERVDDVAARIRSARHNTGMVAEKLRQLDESLAPR